MEPTSIPLSPQALLEELNGRYERLHTAKEDAFWRVKMGLAQDPGGAQREFSQREAAFQALLQDPQMLERVRVARGACRLGSSALGPPAELEQALEGWERTLSCHVIENAQARALAAEIVADEARLEHARGELELSHRDESGREVRASSVKLSTLIRAHADERVRRSAWEALRRIEPYVLERGFLELLAKRNRLGRMLGAQDYYDWKVRRVEGLDKRSIFGWLEDLERRTRDSARRAIDGLRARHGAERMTPWNLAFLTSGDVTRDTDPYFPFQRALATWGQSFTHLGIDYQAAELVLDLVDRPGKYENGFMHGPVIAWRDRGRLRPARIQFTANAIPGLVGSGQRALATLFHEGGHAAHFANVDMPAPCFGQEYAPTSTGFSETQSMFLDSLVGDADWRTRYARTLDGEPMPFALIERGLRAGQPLAAWGARSMLAVCFGERALYELPERELTSQRVLETLRRIERELLFLDEGAPLPILAVPHLLSGESSAYYHGYVLAELAVHQTRRFFLDRDGILVDNPRIGPDLRQRYWKPGNSRSFGQFIRDLTGKELSAVEFARRVSRTADEAVDEARAAVERWRARGTPPNGGVRLNARIRVQHGRHTVARADGDAEFERAARDFAAWIDGLIPRAA
jgi:hypothetical protein